MAVELRPTLLPARPPADEGMSEPRQRECDTERRPECSSTTSCVMRRDATGGEWTRPASGDEPSRERTSADDESLPESALETTMPISRISMALPGGDAEMCTFSLLHLCLRSH